MNINEALGDVRRPLQIGDWVECIDPGNWMFLSSSEWPTPVSEVNEFGAVRFSGCDQFFASHRFCRVDPPTSEVDEVAELLRQLAEVTRERDEYYVKAKPFDDRVSQLTRERDELQLINENLGRLNANLADYSEKCEKKLSDLRDNLATAEADAAAIREVLHYKESAGKHSIYSFIKQHTSDFTAFGNSPEVIAWASKLIARIDAASSGTAGSELLDPAWFGDVEPIYWRFKDVTTSQRNGFADWMLKGGVVHYSNEYGRFTKVSALTKVGLDSDQECERCNADGTPLVKSDDDANLLRKLRELLQGTDIPGHAMCVVYHAAVVQAVVKCLIAIRDGGAK
jgi:hypothetical protein